MIKRTKLKNIETYAFSSKDVFLDFIKDKQKILIAINAIKILNEDKKLHKIINDNIAYADGVGAVMALKQKGLDSIKISGAEFWLDIVNRFYKEKSFYLLGASQEVIHKTVRKLKKEYPNVRILGYRNGFLKEEDKEKLIEELKNLKPDVVFVAQGSPRQAFLVDELINRHPALYMGLGGSFDVYSGLKQRAPKFFLKSNLEWLYRLSSEPTRYKRQLGLFKFFLYLVSGRLQLFKHKS